MVTKSALFLLTLTLGCNAISGIDEFAVGLAPDTDVEVGDAGSESSEVHPESALDVDAAVEAEVAADAGPPEADSVIEADVTPTSKRVFITSESYTADLGGLAGADAKCQKLADAAKLGGTYRAWLSDSATSAKTRLTHATVPYRLVDGTTIAADWVDLTSGSLAHAIDMTEKGGKPPASLGCLATIANAWTNSLASGARYESPGFSCSDWTSATGSSGSSFGHYAIGRTDKSDGWWSSACASTACDGVTAGLYCFEQ